MEDRQFRRLRSVRRLVLWFLVGAGLLVSWPTVIREGRFCQHMYVRHAEKKVLDLLDAEKVLDLTDAEKVLDLTDAVFEVRPRSGCGGIRTRGSLDLHPAVADIAVGVSPFGIWARCGQPGCVWGSEYTLILPVLVALIMTGQPILWRLRRLGVQERVGVE